MGAPFGLDRYGAASYPMTENPEKETGESRQLLADECREMLGRRDLTSIRKRLGQLDVPDLADVLREFDRSNRVVIFRLLPRSISSEVLVALGGEGEKSLVAELTDDEARRVLEDLAPDDRTQLFEELPGLATQRLLNLLDPSELVEARLLLGYPEESVGRLMTPDYIAVRENWSVGRALEHIRARGGEAETIQEVFVTDDKWRLTAVIDLPTLVLADPDVPVSTVMDRNFASVSASEDRERAVEIIGRHDRVALPALDPEGVLVGIVTIDDLLDVAEQEATEDFQRAAAIEPLGMRYTEASFFRLYRNRVSWLILLVLVALLSSAVIAAFETTLESVIALAFFIPLLIGAGGNTGAQSATLVIRAIATGDLLRTQWLRALAKEVGVGAALGLTMGLAASLLGLWRGGIEIGLVVGLTMASIVLVANLLGAMLPFLLTRFGLDPAVASSPLIQTLMDAIGLTVYFTIAVAILSATGTL